jgi:ankyrin repeat protein
MVKLLLERGADPNVCNVNGKSPLHEAASRGDAGTLKLLIERGADLNARYKGLDSATTAERLGHVAAARLLGLGSTLKKSSNF